MCGSDNRLASLYARGYPRAPDPGGRAVLQMVNLHQPNHGGVERAADNRGVSARYERRENCRFTIVARFQAGRFDIGLLVVFPIVIRHQSVPESIVELE